jgi:hypothetical protein
MPYLNQSPDGVDNPPVSLLKTMISVINIGLILLLMLTVHSSRENQDNLQYPSDLYLEIVTGGVEPWENREHVFLWSDGKAIFEIWSGQPSHVPLKKIEFTVSADDLLRIWRLIKKGEILSLDSTYTDPDIRGGSYAGIYIKFDQTSHSVRTQNIHIEVIQALILAINDIIPESYSLHYSIPEK